MKRRTAVLWVQGFFITLPLWEIYRSFFHSRFEIGPLALEEVWLLFMGLCVLGMGSAYALKKGRKKALWGAFAALAALLVYTFIHAFYAAGFNASLVPEAAPSFATECYYVIRLYLAAYAILAGMFLLNIRVPELMPALKIAGGITAGVIVVCCLTGTGFATYREGNTRLAGGFFTWFSAKRSANYQWSTAKGLFSSGNEIGAILFFLSPLYCRDALAKTRKWYDLVLVGIVGFAGVALGTRVGATGTLLVIAFTLVLAFINAWRQKSFRALLRRAVPYVLILIVLIGLFLISPGRLMQVARAETASVERPSTATLPVGDDQLSEHVEEEGWNHYVDKWFPEIYPPENDPEFWRDVLARDGRQNQDARAFKGYLIARIIQRDGRAGDFWLGIGRTSGVPYSERDLSFQAQVYGVIGAILYLLPFAAVGVLAGIAALKRLIAGRDFTLQGACCLSLVAAFGAAYFAGHVFDSTMPTYMLIAPASLAFACREV